MDRPDLNFEYKIEDEVKIIRWTYGLSTDIQRLVPNIDDAISHLQFRPEIRDYALRRCLTEKKGFIKEEADLIDPEVIDNLDPETVLGVLDWVQGHLMYFFASSAENTHTRVRALKTTLAQQNPSTDGSPGSPSTKPVAGPLD